MKYAVIDCETTGLFKFRDAAGNGLRADAPGQPRVAHFTMIRLNEKFEREDVVDALIKPDGWTMPAEAGAINGLNDAILNEKGIPILGPITEYAAAIDEGRVIVAFNAAFDLKCGRAEFRHAKMDDRFEKTLAICVMKAMTDICRIERMRPGGGFKQPKLSEACEHFGITNRKAHSALGDAEAAEEILRRLHAMGKLPEPRLEFAAMTNKPTTIATAEPALPSMDF
jgi:DNA polymerase III epsilon subunit-like protein